MRTAHRPLERRAHDVTELVPVAGHGELTAVPTTLLTSTSRMRFKLIYVVAIIEAVDLSLQTERSLSTFDKTFTI